jgi:porphobilinogen synthase
MALGHYVGTGLTLQPGFPHTRLRRLRRTRALRDLVARDHIARGNLVQPLFVREGITNPQPIRSMPGIVQHTRDSVRKAAAEAVAAGVGGLMLFGIPEHRDAEGSAAMQPDGIQQCALRDVIKEVGNDTVVISDLNLDEYTDHGHSGLLDSAGDVHNDLSIERFGAVAVTQAEAGAHVIAPSGMMDGQVRAIRNALDQAGHEAVAILGYSAKFASHFYGPFRDAVESTLRGDRKTYQQDSRRVRESLHEVYLDIAEGADMVMVKPAGLYLDIVRQVADAVTVPVAAYQVSGEYSMLEAAAQHGWVSRGLAIRESLSCIGRAGATVVITYWATEFAAKLD